MIKTWPSKDMTVIKATPQGGLGGLKRKKEADATEGPKKAAQGGPMKGGGPMNPPWRQEGKGCNPT
eukprot:4945280-Heterocapsa_arctica.AAC.1